MFDRKSTFGKLNSKLTCPLATMNPCLTIITAPQKNSKRLWCQSQKFPYDEMRLAKKPKCISSGGDNWLKEAL